MILEEENRLFSHFGQNKSYLYIQKMPNFLFYLFVFANLIRNADKFFFFATSFKNSKTNKKRSANI